MAEHAKTEPPRKPTSSRIVYENPWIKIREDKTIDQNGTEGLYGYLDTPDSVNIVVLDDQQRFCLQKSFRYPTTSWGWETPGGGSDGEDVLVAAKRELEEETGIVAQTWVKLSSTYVCNGLMTERQSTFVASDIQFTGTAVHAEEAFDGMKFVTFDEAAQMVENGDIDDNQTITAVYLAEQWLRKERS